MRGQHHPVGLLGGHPEHRLQHRDDEFARGSYQRARSLPHAGDSRRVAVLDQCLLSKQEALMGRAIGLRDD